MGEFDAGYGAGSTRAPCSARTRRSDSLRAYQEPAGRRHCGWVGPALRNDGCLLVRDGRAPEVSPGHRPGGGGRPRAGERGEVVHTLLGRGSPAPAGAWAERPVELGEPPDDVGWGPEQDRPRRAWGRLPRGSHDGQPPVRRVARRLPARRRGRGVLADAGSGPGSRPTVPSVPSGTSSSARPRTPVSRLAQRPESLVDVCPGVRVVPCGHRRTRWCAGHAATALTNTQTPSPASARCRRPIARSTASSTRWTRRRTPE